MKIIQLQLYILICCQYAVSDLLTDLRSNVSINCDLDENEVYWILLKTSDPPTVILLSLLTPVSPHYNNKTFRKKYSVQLKHRLVINNVTADELGVYYCMNTETPPKLSNSTRIYFNEAAQLTDCHSQTVLDYIDQNQTKWQIMIITSELMNGLLLIVLIGLVKIFVVGIRRQAEQSRECNIALRQTQAIEQNQDPDGLQLKTLLLIFQYAEVDFSKLRKNRSSQVNSSYAALNLRKS